MSKVFENLVKWISSNAQGLLCLLIVAVSWGVADAVSSALMKKKVSTLKSVVQKAERITLPELYEAWAEAPRTSTAADDGDAADGIFVAATAKEAPLKADPAPPPPPPEVTVEQQVMEKIALSAVLGNGAVLNERFVAIGQVVPEVAVTKGSSEDHVVLTGVDRWGVTLLARGKPVRMTFERGTHR